MTSETPGPPITADGIWLSVRGAPAAAPVPGLFLDRDGVIIEDIGFLRRAEDVRLLPAIAELIGRANAAGIPVGVVTNQSGIARGLLGWDDFDAVERRCAALLQRAGARLDAVAACPFHPDFTIGYGPRHARWRKPGPEMLRLIGARLNIAMAASWLIGDKAIDIAAARNAGLAGAVHVSTGQEEQERKAALREATADFAVQPARGAAAALAFLVENLPGLAG